MRGGQRILVKVGGAILDDPDAQAEFADSVVATVAAGHPVVVVHGGGQQVTRLTDALGLVPRRVRGLRVTDDATAGAVLQVLGGEVNAQLVAAVERAGGARNVHAIGVTGADGGLMGARVTDPELGHVGEVTSVQPGVLDHLVAAGLVPIVATVVPGDIAGGPFLNVNADAAVAPLAAAWKADAVLFLSDVAHVRGDHGRIESLDRRQATELEKSGTIAGGMIPKVLAALDAAEALPGAIVKIASGSPEGVEAGPIEVALRADVGTLFGASTAEVQRGWSRQ